MEQRDLIMYCYDTKVHIVETRNPAQMRGWGTFPLL